MDINKKVKELKDLPEKELNKELQKLNKEEFNKIVNHLTGKILEKRYE